MALSNGYTTCTDDYMKTTVLSQRDIELYKLLSGASKKVQVDTMMGRIMTNKSININSSSACRMKDLVESILAVVAANATVTQWQNHCGNV